MTDRNDFDMYSNYDDKIPLRKKEYNSGQSNKEEFGSENSFVKKNSKNKESFADWVEKMTREHEK